MSATVLCPYPTRHAFQPVTGYSDSGIFVGEIKLDSFSCQIRDNGLDSVAGYPPTQMRLFDHHSSGADGSQHVITGPVENHAPDSAHPALAGTSHRPSPPLVGRILALRYPPSEFPGELAASDTEPRGSEYGGPLSFVTKIREDLWVSTRPPKSQPLSDALFTTLSRARVGTTQDPNCHINSPLAVMER